MPVCFITHHLLAPTPHGDGVIPSECDRKDKPAPHRSARFHDDAHGLVTLLVLASSYIPSDKGTTTMKTYDVSVTDYEPGDVVRLITGGPEMTVLDICPDCGDIGCGWFNQVDNHWHFEAIEVPAESLRPAEVN